MRDSYAHEISPILTDIYRDSIITGTVPLKWKNANVCAIFKKSKKSDPANYRPISLTCIASKILEHKVVFSQSLETQMTMVKCTNAGGRTKGANERSIVFVHQHGGDDVT